MVQFLQASADQLRVTFNVTGGDREAPGATFCCQYGVLAEHRQERLSDLSKPLQVSFPGKALPPARGPRLLCSPPSLCSGSSLCSEVFVGLTFP